MCALPQVLNHDRHDDICASEHAELCHAVVGFLLSAAPLICVLL